MSILASKLSHSKKFLMFYSHVGHEFRGTQKQAITERNKTAVRTVQETIENVMKLHLNPIHDVVVTPSSRTDAEVHALRTSAHFSLSLETDLVPEAITCHLNKAFLADDIGIRVQSCHLIPPWFCSRYNAVSRTYVYRFAIRKTPLEIRDGSIKHNCEIPFSEHHRTLFLQDSTTSVPLMQDAISLMCGTKDFFSFMGRPSRSVQSTTIRTIYSLTLKPATAFMPDHDPNSHLFDYWHLTCTGRSYLYRQIRRMAGVIIAVGQRRINLEDVKKLLDEPCVESWNPRAICVPAWGLYLANITYNPLEMNPNIIDVLDNADVMLERRMTYALET